MPTSSKVSIMIIALILIILNKEEHLLFFRGCSFVQWMVVTMCAIKLKVFQEDFSRPTFGFSSSLDSVYKLFVYFRHRHYNQPCLPCQLVGHWNRGKYFIHIMPDTNYWHWGQHFIPIMDTNYWHPGQHYSLSLLSSIVPFFPSSHSS